ncbi:EamA family transporter RarD [Paenibacillus alginolyticus]|uniref:EamA family transporter RarD n=1 Tax=Paenibacillus alginolyticus TaxID=59839 RepID=A0ABT4GGH9_9BACL|nr:EamA family transporter RarD [Paenibacillus alginolyticus]MCY9695184.1 EamA family transporter RarD [Paenibacillus alginolyticus]MEC0143119.1 EamA family transporter RarD [Paenibacillus alginolyticus]
MKKGLWYAILAYIAWGLLPVYWRSFGSLLAGEILSHRVIWSFVFMAILLLIGKSRWKEFREMVTNRKALLQIGISSILISSNWLIFIWAVNNGHVIETSLGYYITPLINIMLAVLFLREKPSRSQWVAVALAGAGVLLATIDYGRFPWVSLSLALSFGLYSLVKKRVSYDASIGLAGETVIVFPIAVAYIAYLHFTHHDSAWALPPISLAMLLLSGVATALPLLWFAKAAARLPLSMLGFIQYIGPSITLLLSVFLFKEKFSPVLLISFSLIWTALIVYALASMRVARTSVAE